MSNGGCNLRKYMVVTTVGAISGGILVALASRAIPKMMAGMMRNMMAMMGGEGCSPADM
ncbi:MAG: hypothetical protein ABIK32_00930 [Chloroflexota bacterium]|nr:hypothetical protein [Chloroflexota bacterium]